LLENMLNHKLQKLCVDDTYKSETSKQQKHKRKIAKSYVSLFMLHVIKIFLQLIKSMLCKRFLNVESCIVFLKSNCNE